jgi:NAD(P)-dependent dehydrogenase (short-subunit alcohol dehydrogenase family)
MTSPSSLAGQRALVTGGSSGIGAAIVRRLAAQGATVAVNYRSDQKAAEALVGELHDSGCAAAAFPADIGDRAQTHALVGAVVSEFGGLACWSATPGSSTSERWKPSPRPTSTASSRPTWPDSCSSSRRR